MNKIQWVETDNDSNSQAVKQNLKSRDGVFHLLWKPDTTPNFMMSKSESIKFITPFHKQFSGNVQHEFVVIVVVSF